MCQVYDEVWVSDCCFSKDVQGSSPSNPGTIESGPNDPVVVCGQCGCKCEEIAISEEEYLLTDRVQFWSPDTMMGLRDKADAIKALGSGKWKIINDQAIRFIGDPQ